ncbi:transaldolase [Acidaminobacter sp. JC074]|uniref:transaldolase family protein n=1 Tax=Acidaminobacter sp. JC074 TaxID=2530199 RepID=UPI001F111B4D|nr:transaldolase family protein [Acidaminobacter sp. JC074]MCH4889816.1 transaldolase [Acidaminobacter sp. JC074]
MSKQFKSPLHETAMTTPTDFWNDSCSIPELTYAMEHGAVGATTNPVIVGNVLKNEMDKYEARIFELIKDMPEATEDDIAWTIIEEMAVEGAKILEPLYHETKGQKGRISIQTNTKFYRSAKLMADQAVGFHQLAPNMQIKMPTTSAGIEAFEEATYRGASINATVSYTVPQALAVAEAVERGLKRRESEGLPTEDMHPVCTIMVGRLDDWLKDVANRDHIIVDPAYLEMAGVATFKNAYKIYKEKGYRTQLLAAAYRNHHQWSDFIGGDVSLTIPFKWQKRFNGSDITVENRMDNPVDPKAIEALKKHFPDFVKAYEADGMTVEEFDTYGAVTKTLKQFLAGYDSLIEMIRDRMVIIK